MSKNFGYMRLNVGRLVVKYLILVSSWIPFKILVDSVYKPILGFVSQNLGYVGLNLGRLVEKYLIFGSSRIALKILVDSLDKPYDPLVCTSKICGLCV